MKRTIRVGVQAIAFGVMMTGWLQADGVPRIPIENFFRSRALSVPKLNPSGTHLVNIIQDESDHEVAVVFDIEKDKKYGVRGGADRDVYSTTWLDDQHLLCDQATEKYFVDGMFVVDMRKMKDSYAVEKYSVVRLLAIPKKTPLQPLVWEVASYQNEGADGGVSRIDASRSLESHMSLDSGVVAEIRNGERVTRDMPMVRLESYAAPKSGSVFRYYADVAGELRYALTLDKKEIRLMVREGSDWITSPLRYESDTILRAGEQGDEVWVLHYEDGHPNQLRVVSARTGALVKEVYRDEHYDLEGVELIVDRVSSKIVGFRYNREVLTTVWIDPSFGELQQRIDKLFPNKIVAIHNWNSDVTRLVVAVFSDRSPVVNYLVDLKANVVRRLSEEAPWIKEDEMGATTPVHFANRDGIQVDGYLTLPRGTSREQKAPMIVMPHGGPFARDVWGWDGEVQFLVNRGYAVFQPEYRGSTGTRWRFPSTGASAFRAMSDDVTDGVKYVLRTGLIDAKRVAIFGGSFGGFLALSGLERDGNLYRCAVAQAGVYDWKRLLTQMKRDDSDGFSTDAFKYAFDDGTMETSFNEISPINHVDQVKVPVFVVHGASDDVVDISQSKRLVAELKKYNVPCETLFKSREGHAMARVKDQIELYAAIEAFLEKT